MDEFIDDLLREDRANDVILPRIQKRYILEEANEIEPRVSLLEADDLDEDLEVNKIYFKNHIYGKNLHSFIVIVYNFTIISLLLQDEDEEEEHLGKNRSKRTIENDEYMSLPKRNDDGKRKHSIE